MPARGYGDRTVAAWLCAVPSLDDVAHSDAVLVLGEDVTNTAPMLALSLRQSTLQREIDLTRRLHIHWWDDAAVREALQQRRGPLFVATPAATRLDDVATHLYRAAPDDLVRFAAAITYALGAPVPPLHPPTDDLAALVEKIAETLYHAQRPLVVSGTGGGSEAMLHAAANVAWALCRAGRCTQLCLAVPECNTLGLGLIGGGSLDNACRAVAEGKADTVIVLENDLFRRADADTVNRLLKTAKHTIVIDHLESPTTAAAEIVLPAATFAESDGTLVNYEGRAQRFFRVFTPAAEIRESWGWLGELMVAAGRANAAPWADFDQLVAALAEAMPVFAPVKEIAPPAGFRIAGQKIPRQPHRYSGRTAISADATVAEGQPPDDADSALAFSMEGSERQPPPPLVAHFWAPGWNSVQAVTRFQEEVNGPLRGGDSGRRLIEPARDATLAYLTDLPPAFETRPYQWLLVPLHHVFGSEELSVLSPGVAQLAPPSYVAMCGEDARRLGVEEGDAIDVYLDNVPWRLPLRRMPSLPAGVAGIPLGLPGGRVAALPKWAKLAKADLP